MTTQTKMKPCCAKFAVALGAEKAELRSLAMKAARPSQAHRMSIWKARIAKQKAVIAEAEQNIVDHEAGHAA